MNLSHAHAASENQSNQVVIETAFPKPLKQLNLSAEWVNQDSSAETDDSDVNDGISYEYFDNEDVILGINGGKKIKSKKASLRVLEKQLITFAKGKSSEVPLLSESIGITADDWNEFKEAGFSIEPKMTHVVIKGQEWLKTKMLTQIEITYSETIETVDGIETTETVSFIPLISNVYYSFIKGAIYMVSFAAPSDQYATYESLFESTMQNLY